MSKGFTCDTDEMRALIARHEELRSDLERVIVPPKGAAWGFSVVRGAYKELAEDCADRREIMQEWCTRMSEAIEATSRESEQADATWADVIKDDRLTSL
jgi:hypothetical protein